jgi:hypothetical protein
VNVDNVVIRTAVRAIACAVIAFLPIAVQAGVAPAPFPGLGANGAVFASPDGFGAARAKSQDCLLYT